MRSRAMRSRASSSSRPDGAPDEDPGRRVSRRRVLAGGAVAGLGGLAPLVVPRHVLGGTGFQAPSDTLRIAAVGVGGVGRAYLEGCGGERVVALCDLDHALAGPTFAKYPDAKRYHDFRKMLEKEAKSFDALIVATPDHTHTVILMAALQLGKHIYCAKPVTHTVGEARKVRQAVQDAKQLVTKTSVQSSGTEGARRTAELLRSGVIGPVRELHVWCHHPIYPCSVVRPTGTPKPPEGMDWDLWIGPALYRPYHPAYHPWRWRPWWDFGTGTVGDMGCHTFHVYFRELELGAPGCVYGWGSTRREGFATLVETPECQSHANMVTWEFPARGKLPPLQVHWYDGGMKPHRPVELDHTITLPQSGLLFVGDKGKLLAAYSGGNATPGRGLAGGLLLPETEFRDFEEPTPSLRRVPDHYGEWTAACKTGDRTVCPIEFGCEMTEMGLLGALALRIGGGQVLEWDARARCITNNETANALLDPPYRDGWSV